MRIFYGRSKPEFQLELCNTHLEHTESAMTSDFAPFRRVEQKEEKMKKIQTEKHKLKFYCGHWCLPPNLCWIDIMESEFSIRSQCMQIMKLI